MNDVNNARLGENRPKQLINTTSFACLRMEDGPLENTAIPNNTMGTTYHVHTGNYTHVYHA